MFRNEGNSLTFPPTFGFVWLISLCHKYLSLYLFVIPYTNESYLDKIKSLRDYVDKRRVTSSPSSLEKNKASPSTFPKINKVFIVSLDFLGSFIYTKDIEIIPNENQKQAEKLQELNSATIC